MVRARSYGVGLAATLLVGLAACSSSAPAAGPATSGGPPSVAVPLSAAVPAPRRTLTILTLNDLHGRIEALPLFAAYVANVRAARAADGGGVLVLDGGDMFQGTLESNLGEGAAVVDGYAALRFDAVAVGNHEFDFGPVGPNPTPRAPGEDPRGALFARAAAAPFPFLLANVVLREGRARLTAPNLKDQVLVDVAGVPVGLFGLTTAELLHTTISANVGDLEVEPLAEVAVRSSKQLRARGAALVVAVAHAGGKCPHFTGDVDADACQPQAEAFALARSVPPGTLDVLVGGHTHAGVAHVVEGVAIEEAYAYGTHFGRIDVELEGTPLRPTKIVPVEPHLLCPEHAKAPPWATCAIGDYEGRPLVRDARVAAAIAPHLERAADKKAERLGVTLDGGDVRGAYGRESPLGNLLADLLLEARPGATFALMNGGGLRADLPAGDLTYGALFEAFPFDNRLGTVKLRARDLAAILARNAQGDGGILSLAGGRAVVRCDRGKVSVDLQVGGRGLAPDAEVVVLASDFLLTGGDAFWGDAARPAIDEGTDAMRDVLAAGLSRRGRVDARALVDPKAPRLQLPGPRPLRCSP